MQPPPAHSLLVQHAHADREIEALERAVRGVGDVKSCFDAFESEILRHFETEERQLFPAYERESPEDAAELRGQHAHFRSLLAEARGFVDRNVLVLAHVRRLRIALSLHHAHEETGLYRWARQQWTGTQAASPR